MWELDCEESWAPKNWGFQATVLEKTLESLFDSKMIKPVSPIGNQSWIFNEIFHEYSMMLKLKLQYFGHLMGRTDSFVKTLMLGKIEGRRRRGQQKMRLLDDITNSMGMSLSKLLELGDGQGILAFSVRGVAKNQTWLRDWTELNWGNMDPWAGFWDIDMNVVKRKCILLVRKF